jgi:hypothetical protein
MNFKKGTMFGLDARIALAIFGALSVISGAALYSAIQDAKVTRIITDMTEYGKAWEAYMLDTGLDVPPYDDSNPNDYLYYHNKNLQLSENVDNVAGWKGPYVGYKHSGGVAHEYPPATYINLLTLDRTVEFGHGKPSWTAALCTAGKSCYKYISINGVESVELAKAIDLKIDGSDTPSTGKLRWKDNSPSWEKIRINMEYAPVKNPNG